MPLARHFVNPTSRSRRPGRCAVFTLFVLLIAVVELHAQDSLPKGVAGCWAVSLGLWQPRMNLGEDTIYSTPPSRIEIVPTKGTEGFERRGWRVVPAPGTNRSVHRFAYMMPLTTDSVRIAWTTGFSGLTMRLEVKGDSLRGKAQTFWDFDRAHQTADATLTRVACH